MKITIGMLSLLVLQPLLAASSCWLDPSTGLVAPTGGSGACLFEQGGSQFLVQHSRDGILLAQLFNDGQPAPVNSNFLFAPGRSGRLIYCPADVPGDTGGVPAKDCLLDSEHPGPAAFTGFGVIQAGAVTDSFGTVQCPSSIQVRGMVHSPGGEGFELHSSLVRFSNLAGQGSCDTLRDEISLAPRSRLVDPASATLAAASVPGGQEAPLLDAETAAIVEAAATLSERNWDLLKRLSRLENQDWATLQTVLETHGAVQIGVDGSLAPPGQPVNAGIPVQQVTLSELQTELSGIKTDVSSINTNVGTVLTNLQQVINKLQHFDLNLLQQFFPAIQDAVHDALGYLQFIRANFQQFKGSNCGTGSPCAAFLADVRQFLDQLAVIRDLAPVLLDVDPPVKFELDQIRNTFLSNVPPFALYLINLGLEQAVPTWRTIPDDILARIPPELMPDSSTAAKSAALGPSGAAISLQDRICIAAIKNPAIIRPLVGLKLYLKLSSDTFDLVKELCPDDVNADVAGEGGSVAGFPCNFVLGAFSKILGYFAEAVDKLIDKVNDCEPSAFQDSEREKSLTRCEPIVSFFLPRSEGGQLDSLIELVDLRIFQAGNAGLPVGTAPTLLGDAMTLQQGGDFQGSYQTLCEAYAQLAGSLNQTGPPPCVPPNGGPPGGRP